MKFKTFLTASFTVLLLIGASTSFAQHLVLFETFTNSCQPSSASDDAARTTFNSNVSSVVSSEGSKIIHLDHHIGNECDELQNAYSFNTANHIVPGSATLQSTQVFWGAADRTVFSSTGTRGSPNTSDWSTAIDQDAGQPPAATLELIDATLDKSNSNTYKLHADVKVTLSSSIPDSLIIRYAVVQDSCVDNQNGGTNNVILNDVVREITYSNASPYLVFATGGSAGMQKTMTWDVPLHGPTNFNDAVHLNYPRIRLVAFLEEANGSNFHVVNAAVLRQDLDTLQAPKPTLVLYDSLLNGKTFYPGATEPIQYTSSNLPQGIAAYYSLDNGTTWRFISNSYSSPINWTVPDSLTTQGKIKLVAVGNTSLTSTESGNFTIGQQPAVTFVHPMAGEVLQADSTYTFQWTKFSVAGVRLLFSFANQSGGFPKFDTIADHITDTFYHWTVPDTNIIVQFQLVPDSGAGLPNSVIDTIKKLFKQGVRSTSAPDGLSIISVFPNPASSGEDMIVQFTQAEPRHVTLQVLDLLGHIVGQFYPTANQTIHLDTRALASGSYIVRLSDGIGVVSKQVEIMR